MAIQTLPTTEGDFWKAKDVLEFIRKFYKVQPSQSVCHLLNELERKNEYDNSTYG